MPKLSDFVKGQNPADTKFIGSLNPAAGSSASLTISPSTYAVMVIVNWGINDNGSISVNGSPIAGSTGSTSFSEGSFTLCVAVGQTVTVTAVSSPGGTAALVASSYVL